MAYSPYQTAGSQATLYDLFEQSKLRQQKASSATRRQRSKLTEEFEAELEAAQKAAQKKANKNKGFFKGLNILGSFLGPLGAGLTKGISALGQGQQQKKGLEQLLKGVDMERWGKTFLKDPSKSYKEEAESMQMSSGDVLRGAFGAGLSGWGTSKMMGGKRNEGLGQKMFSKPTTPAASGVGIQGPDFLSESSSSISPYKDLTSFNPTEAGLQAPDFLKDIKQEGLGGYFDSAVNELPISKGIGIKPDLLNKMKSWSQEASIGKATPFKNLFEELQNFGKGVKGMDKMQQSMMLPILLQQLFGGEY